MTLQQAGDKLGVSRQRVWQLLKEADGLCRICGRPAVRTGYCGQHRNIQNSRSLARYYNHRNEILDRLDATRRAAGKVRRKSWRRK